MSDATFAAVVGLIGLVFVVLFGLFGESTHDAIARFFHQGGPRSW